MNSSLLLEIMNEKGISQEKLSNGLHITRQGLWKKITGKSEFKISEMNAISVMLKLNLKQKNAIFFSDCVGKSANKG